VYANELGCTVTAVVETKPSVTPDTFEQATAATLTVTVVAAVGSVSIWKVKKVGASVLRESGISFTVLVIKILRQHSVTTLFTPDDSTNDKGMKWLLKSSV